MNMRNELVPRSTIAQIAKDRARALEQMEAASLALQSAWADAAEAQASAQRAAMGARYVYSHARGSSPEGHLHNPTWNRDEALLRFRKGLDRDVWAHLLQAVGVGDMMDREAHEKLQASIQGDDVPEATEDNMRATVESLFRDADMIFRRGLANAFCTLDRRFRSHDGFKLGGRIILTRAFDDWGHWNYHSKMRETICDIERVFAVLDEQAPDPRGLIHAIEASRGRGMDPRQSECEARYLRILGYKNGNAHLWFTRDDLVRKANQILAEWYGDVIGDAHAEGKPEDLFNRSVVPASDLQFFATPERVVEELLGSVQLDGVKMLEPSAGTGAIAIAAARKGARVTAVEIDFGRHAILRAEASRCRFGEGGYMETAQANFLQMKPTPEFGLVVMNPPFFGHHYMDHITHAMKFLVPGGILRAVVPATAEVGESKKHEAFRAFCKAHADGGWRGPFEDLPDGSFRDVGTNVNTCVLKLRAKR